MDFMEDLLQFEGTDKNTYHFVKTVKDHVMVWKKLKDDEYICGRLDLGVVNEEILDEAGIWNKLSKKIQGIIVEAHAQQKEEHKEKMADVRKGRKKKYNFSHLPEFLKCECGREVKANYYYLQKKADKQAMPLDDLVKAYRCQKCNPTKGKKK